MSATGRGGAREADDFYATPTWAVQAGLSMLGPASPRILVRDPCCGDGAILAVAARAGFAVCGVELDAERASAARVNIAQIVTAELPPGPGEWPAIVTGDFLRGVKPTADARPADTWGDVVNPPYREAEAFVYESMRDAPDFCLYLLRMAFLATSTRRDFWRDFVADVGLLVRRPSFQRSGGREGGGTDACEYGWFAFRRRLPDERDKPTTVRRMEDYGPPKRTKKPRAPREVLAIGTTIGTEE